MLSMILCARKQVSKRRNWGQSNKLTFLHLILLIRRDSPWSVIILDFFIRFKMASLWIWDAKYLTTSCNQMRGSYFEWHFSLFLIPALWKRPVCYMFIIWRILKKFSHSVFFLIFMLLALFLFLFLSILFFFLSNQKEKGKRTHLLSIYTGIFGSFDIHQFEISSLMNCIFS